MSQEAGRWDLCFGMGIVSWPGGVVTFRGDAIRRDLDALRAAGIRWIQTGGINLWDRVAGNVDDMIAASAAWIDAAGMRVSSFHCAGPNYARLDLSQEPVVEKLIGNVERFAPLKARTFVIHAGWIKFQPEDLVRLPDSALRHGECDRILLLHDEFVQRFGEDAVVRTAAANLKAMARAAQKHGIRLAFENMGDMLPLGDRRALTGLVKLIDEPNVGYCLDSGHAWLRGDAPQDMVRWMGDRLFETHFHDCRGGSRAEPPRHEQDEHLPVGFGTIDWRAVIAALNEIGFPGPVTFETDGWSLSGAPADNFRHAIEWWRIAERLALKK
jgi:sugar phosphate isomerase/epimerase